MGLFRERSFKAAVQGFDSVLRAEPDHFAARLMQGVSYLRSKRPTEAKIALTACIGQTPRFAWAYVPRGHAWLQLEAPDFALRDFRRALDALPASDRIAFWQDRILARDELTAWRDRPAFQQILRDLQGASAPVSIQTKAQDS